MATSRTGPSGDAANPAKVGYAVTTSDSVDLPQGPCRALYIGVTGDVTVQHLGGIVSTLYKGVPVGPLPIECSRVMATGTTATNIVALY